MTSKHNAEKSAPKKADILVSATTNPMNAGAKVKDQGNQTADTAARTGLLDDKEQKLLTECEADIGQNLQGWCILGFRLWQIREHKLFRTPENRSFETYLDEKWDYSKAHANRLIKAHLCVKHLESIDDVDLYIPTKEAEVRYISNLAPGDQVEVACEVFEAVGGKRATAESFKVARDKIFPPPVREPKPPKTVNGADGRNEDTAQPNVAGLLTNGSNLVPISEIKAKVQSLYNIFTNSAKKQDGLNLIGKIQKDLEQWAAWQAKQLNQKEAV